MQLFITNKSSTNVIGNKNRNRKRDKSLLPIAYNLLLII